MSSAPDDPLAGSIAALRARLVTLADARASGGIDDATYEAARREVERALGDAILATSAPTPPVPRPPRPSIRLVALLVGFVVVVAIGGYSFTGSPTLAGLGAPPPPPPAAQGTSDREIGVKQIAEMVDKLAIRLKERPDDAEGWMMLARSYTVLRRYPDALPAYERAVALQPKNAGLVADYADAIAAANNGQQNAQSLALIDRALAIDPAQPKALALAGTVAFDRGDYATAAAQWQKIADALPPESEFHQQVMANIEEARRRGGLAPTTSASASTAEAAKAAVGHEAVTGTVTLDPALASKAAPDDTVFVLARPESGRMPLAVFRAQVKDLPLRFKLDDSMAMAPTMKMSDHNRVVVAARVSKSGNAISQPGDLLGETGPIAPGTNDLKIRIEQVVPGR